MDRRPREQRYCEWSGGSLCLAFDERSAFTGSSWTSRFHLPNSACTGSICGFGCPHARRAALSCPSGRCASCSQTPLCCKSPGNDVTPTSGLIGGDAGSHQLSRAAPLDTPECPFVAADVNVFSAHKARAWHICAFRAACPDEPPNPKTQVGPGFHRALQSFRLVEPRGIEPLTSWLPAKRSPS